MPASLQPKRPVRLEPRDLVDQADALIPLVAKDASVIAVGSVRRSAVLRLAIPRGLEALEKQYTKKKEWSR